MIITITDALTASGCTSIIYEREDMTNIIADSSKPDDIIGILLHLNFLTLDGPGLAEHYRPVIDICKQVMFEDTAVNNQALMEELKDICKVFIRELIDTGSFQKIPTPRLDYINESKYDANVIGWSITLDLIRIENSTHC